MGGRKCNVLASSQQYLNADCVLGHLITVNPVHLEQLGHTCSGDICCSIGAGQWGKEGSLFIEYALMCPDPVTQKVPCLSNSQARNLCIFSMLFYHAGVARPP